VPSVGAPTIEPREVVLADGARILVRAIGPDDRDRLLEGWQHLSPTSRFRRFFSPMPHLPDTLLEYFTHPDQADHVAIAAGELLDGGQEGAGLGVARFIRLVDRPDAAELAVAVVDDWHGRGVGTALVQRLVELARPRGVQVLTGEVLDENRAMRAVFDRLGATWTRGEPGAHHAEVGVE
jgi:RimJ/RimL family protein N-acetyltransferase